MAYGLLMRTMKILQQAFINLPQHLMTALQAGSKRADSIVLGYQNDEFGYMHGMTSSILDKEASCKKMQEFC